MLFSKEYIKENNRSEGNKKTYLLRFINDVMNMIIIIIGAIIAKNYHIVVINVMQNTIMEK